MPEPATRMGLDITALVDWDTPEATVKVGFHPIKQITTTNNKPNLNLASRGNMSTVMLLLNEKKRLPFCLFFLEDLAYSLETFLAWWLARVKSESVIMYRNRERIIELVYYSDLLVLPYITTKQAHVSILYCFKLHNVRLPTLIIIYHDIEYLVRWQIRLQRLG